MRASELDPSDFRDQIALQASTPTPDTGAGLLQHFTTFDTEFAEIEATAQNVSWLGDQISPTMTDIIKIRWRDDIRAGQRDPRRRSPIKRRTLFRSNAPARVVNHLVRRGASMIVAPFTCRKAVAAGFKTILTTDAYAALCPGGVYDIIPTGTKRPYTRLDISEKRIGGMGPVLRFQVNFRVHVFFVDDRRGRRRTTSSNSP